MLNIHKKIAEIEEGAQKAALCLVTHTRGSTPGKAGAKMIVWDNGHIYGTIGGGSLEKQVISDAQWVLQTQKAQTFHHALLQDHEMCCGGSVEIFIEPIMTKKKLFIFGAGHIGKYLAKFAHELDFQLNIIDERAGIFDDWETDNYHLYKMSHAEAFPQLSFDAECFITVITHNHAYDRMIIAHCAKQPHAYLGMIGSRRKVEIAQKSMLAKGLLTEEEMQNIDWPIGIELPVKTPAEIAIAIVAKLIEIRAKIAKHA